MSFYFAENVLPVGVYLGPPLVEDVEVVETPIHANPSYRYIDNARDSYILNSHQAGDIVTYTWSFKREAKRRGTTVLNVLWRAYMGRSQIKKTYLNGSESSAQILMGEGRSAIETTCTFADGSTSIVVLSVSNDDRECNSTYGNYY